MEAQVREHIKKFKQEKPEMDDFEEEEKTSKEKYFEKFNILLENILKVNELFNGHPLKNDTKYSCRFL